MAMKAIMTVVTEGTRWIPIRSVRMPEIPIAAQIVLGNIRDQWFIALGSLVENSFEPQSGAKKVSLLKGGPAES